jgi:hypothetical protein
MTDPDLVSRISDVLRFVFTQDRDDIVVLVGDGEVSRALPQTAPSLAAQGAYLTNATDIVSGRTRIRRMNETLYVAL